MKKIILLGFGKPVMDLFQNLKNNYEIIGISIDYERRKNYPNFYDFIADENITLLDFEDISDLNPDLVLVINYNKIIDISKLDGLLVLNIHLGILPIYRGNGANAWSILNGNRNVGYSVHEMTEVLDGGQIFYIFEYQIKDNETYLHAREAISADWKTNFLTVIENILNQTLKGIDQQNEDFIYASRLFPEDGILTHWNYETKCIFNHHIVFAKPLGTGLKMKFKDQWFEISKISSIPNYLNASGYPGAIVNIVDKCIWVKTKDTAISIDEIVVDGKLVSPAELYKIGERL